VAAVNPDLVSGDVGRSEKRKTHDVVPVKMGLEHVEDVGLGGTVSAEYMVSEDAYAAAEIAQYVLVVTRIELHAGGIAPKVCETAKSSSESTHARAFSCVSRRLPEAATSA